MVMLAAANMDPMPTRAPRSSISRGDPTATCRSGRASISVWATSSPALRASARWRRSSSAGSNWSWPCRRTLFGGGSGLALGPSKSFLSRSTRNDFSIHPQNSAGSDTNQRCCRLMSVSMGSDFGTRSDHAGERCLGGQRSSFSQDDKWSALINRYITVIPLIGGEPCIAMQSMSGWPLKNPVHKAMIANVGAAARPSQPATARAVWRPAAQVSTS